MRNHSDQSLTKYRCEKTSVFCQALFLCDLQKRKISFLKGEEVNRQAGKVFIEGVQERRG